jgi:hypothetical protein
MLLGYVSDERYVALPDVLLELIDERGNSWETRSRASGSVHADVPAGEYLVTLQKSGFGAKRVRLRVPVERPHHFRLLSDCLLGYAWPKWLRAGEQSEFRVHAVEQYGLSLWRYGWTKEHVRDLGWHDEHGPRATMQVTPDGDYTPTGVGFNRVGYTSPTHKQYVTALERSGLYYFHTRTLSGSHHFAFPWIVAPRRPSAQIAVLACNITWNAYNSFGGRSNYINADELPAVPIVNSRLELGRYTDAEHHTWGFPSYASLSFDRPEPLNDTSLAEKITDPIEGRMACHVAPAEWRLLGWLEREGFAYDLYAETQLDSGVLDLSAYRVLVLSVHPEYWTRKMYQRVKRWVFEEGGRLVYLAGNGLNCETELLPDDTMVVNNGMIKSLWPEGIGAESRFGKRVESEANLLGVVFTPAGAMTGAPYRVVDESHWIFEGTGLRNGELFGTKSLHMRCPGGASGHETDKVSPSSPKNVRVLARGINPDDGGAEIVHFETPGGGAVFSAGSISYPCSLPVDEPLSRITANVFRRFLS